ncbi:MAG: threonylcarbamoyl-AMP synthase [Candidatus Micrarchaeota archaeon]|nr:threonylcarbamoyl-AMP synthase [Candidatus Micrarchaeota archaeon]
MEKLEAGDEALNKCLSTLSKGELIVYPTDTLYGLGADATINGAVEKVFAAKRRPIDKVVSIAVANIIAAEDLVNFTPTAKIIAAKFLPGPLTIILKAKSEMKFVSKDGKIGIRIPDSDFALALLKSYNRPIIATSANLSGGLNPMEVSEIPAEILESVSVVVDQGRTKYSAPSTIVDLSGDTIEIVREGAISIDAIRDAIK